MRIRCERTGTVEVTVDTGSADFGQRQLNPDIKEAQRPLEPTIDPFECQEAGAVRQS